MDRGRKALPPTEQGRIVLKHAEHIFKSMADMLAELGSFRTLDSGTLCFSCGPLLGYKLVPDAISRFNEKYPGIEIQFEVKTTAKARKDLESEEIEFYFGSDGPFRNNSHFTWLRMEAEAGNVHVSSGSSHKAQSPATRH